MIFGEIVPKTIGAAVRRSLGAPRSSIRSGSRRKLFAPVVALLTQLTTWITRMLGVERAQAGDARGARGCCSRRRPSRRGEITEGERQHDLAHLRLQRRHRRRRDGAAVGRGGADGDDADRRRRRARSRRSGTRASRSTASASIASSARCTPSTCSRPGAASVQLGELMRARRSSCPRTSRRSTCSSSCSARGRAWRSSSTSTAARSAS